MHNEDLHNLYNLPDTISMIKPRGIRWAGHTAHMEREDIHTGFWWESQNEGDH
jgi:hypothetical protein